MRIIKKSIMLILDFLEHSSTTVGVILFSAITGIAFVSVILRYFFEIHILWETQILPYVFVWGVFLGAASVTRDHGHIRVSFFAELIFGAERAPRVWTTVENFVGFAAGSYITYLSARWVRDSYTDGALVISEPSYGLWIPRMGIMIGMGLLSIFYAERLVKQVFSWRTGGIKTDEKTTEPDDTQSNDSLESL